MKSLSALTVYEQQIETSETSAPVQHPETITLAFNEQIYPEKLGVRHISYRL